MPVLLLMLGTTRPTCIQAGCPVLSFAPVSLNQPCKARSLRQGRIGCKRMFVSLFDLLLFLFLFVFFFSQASGQSLGECVQETVTNIMIQVQGHPVTYLIETGNQLDLSLQIQLFLSVLTKSEECLLIQFALKITFTMTLI